MLSASKKLNSRDESQLELEEAVYFIDEPDSGGVFILWIIPMILTVFGIVVIASMTGWNLNSPGMKQAIWFVISLGAFVVMTQIPLRFWYKYSFVFLIVALGLIALTVFSPLRVSVKGASRWIRLGPINFQPLEIVSFMLMIHLSKVYLRIKNSFGALILTGVVLAPFFVIIMLQPDFGGLLMLIGIVGALFVESYGMFWPIVGIVAGSPVLYFIANQGYRAQRIMTWLDPWSDPLGAGYQVIQGLIAFANGRIWGIGLGRGQQFLPEVHNDFIFPAIGEQLGLAGTMTIFMLFLVWTVSTYVAYKNARPRRRILIWGCCAAVLMPFFINLGGVMKIIPLTGMPLPFISYGGTSLVFMWARIGLLIRLISEPEDDMEDY